MAFLLVVDDDTEVLGAMCAVLTAAGDNVVPAEGGLHALDILDADKHALSLSACTDMPATVNDAGPKLGKMPQKPILPDDLRRAGTEALAAALTEH